MQSVGEKLKKARLEKNLTLEEVYRQIKIHTSVLSALEQDRAHNFLSFVYIKGFLKNYARFLGLESEQLLKEYIDSQKVKAPSAQPQPPPVAEKKGKVLPQLNPLLALRAGLAIFLVFALAFYFRYVAKNIFHVSEEAPAQKINVKVMPAQAEKVKDLVVEVKTLDSCWLRVTADNQAIFENTLPKGKNERWQAKEKIELRMGRPEALEVFFNGQPIDLAKVQAKKSLVITREGIKGK